MARRTLTTGIEFQDRDAALLRGLFDSRLMTLTHAAAIHFHGSQEAAKKRIQKLKGAGFIGERVRKSREKSILFLTRKGFLLLGQRGRLSEAPSHSWARLERRLQVSELTLRHELEVMDVKASICSCVAAGAGYSIAEFSTWPLLFQFYAMPGSGQDVLVKPDGFLRVSEEAPEGLFEHTFFLELDRSTETLDTLARRALCYLNYYQRGGLAERFGRPSTEYKDFPFRVLMVVKTAERRNNLAERLLIQQPPILTQVWLSTFKEVLENPLGPIWIRPRDYRDITQNTPYATSQASASAIYRRRQDRDDFVEGHIKKHKLLESSE